MMKALVYAAPGIRRWMSVPKPAITKPTDAIVKTLATCICGTDLHILKGDVEEANNRMGKLILGHEAIARVESVGAGVSSIKPGQKVIVKCVTSCGTCAYCTKNLQSHCIDGGWILGHKIDGTQAEFTRIPHADHSLIPIPEDSPISDEALLMLSDILPTGYEIGVLSSKIKQDDTVAIVGAGPVGLATLLTALKFKPSSIIMVDMDDQRLEASKKLGATHTINPSKVPDFKEAIFEITSGIAAAAGQVLEPGVDVAIECVGVPKTFEMCQEIIAPGGRIANVGVHGSKVDLYLQDLWIKNISITTGLVSAFSAEELLENMIRGDLNPESLVTHKFKLDQIEEAYDVFGDAAKNGAIKVFLEAEK